MHNYVSGALNLVRVEVQNADVSFGDEKIVGSSSGNLGTHLILLSDDNTGFMPYRIDNFSMEVNGRHFFFLANYTYYFYELLIWLTLKSFSLHKHKMKYPSEPS